MTGRYSIYAEDKPCLQSGCIYLAKFKNSKEFFSVTPGKQPCIVNYDPKRVGNESVTFVRDHCVGKTVALANGDEFFDKPARIDNGNITVELGNYKRHDFVTFPANFPGPNY